MKGFPLNNLEFTALILGICFIGLLLARLKLGYWPLPEPVFMLGTRIGSREVSFMADINRTPTYWGISVGWTFFGVVTFSKDPQASND